ncbi:hypothetical protein COCOBI_18-1140 [Coccomyxa sp. Obi]|nr:hypothetical protein COCOBI_18-1140 [Coccomyxa sp. Obi]
MALFSFTPAESRQTGDTSTSKQASQEVETMPVKSGSTTSTQAAGTGVQQLPLPKVPEKPAIMRPCRVADTSFVSFQLFTETMSFDW